jgi:sporulation protein YtfJ
MDRHPIESLMGTTMENIRDMVDVNTVIGDPVETSDGVTVIPISRVSFGFVAGGGEYSAGMQPPVRAAQPGAQDEKLPFAGGSGAGVCVQPMGFLIANGSQVKLLSANCQTPVDRVVEMIPQVIGDLKTMCEKEAAEGAKKRRTAKTADAVGKTDLEKMADQYAFTTPPGPVQPADTSGKE